MKALILAAGLGTRLRPFTLEHPKALFKVGNTTLLENAIRFVNNYGYTDLIINVHHCAEQIIACLSANHNFGLNITISDETTKLLDTGGALKKAAWFFDDGTPFLVYNVDIITDLNLELLRRHHCENQAAATLAVRQRHSQRYLLFDENKTLCGWRNAQTGAQKIIRAAARPTQLAFSGIQIMSPEVFPYFPKQDVFSLTDFYLQLAAQGLKITYFDHTPDKWQDIGKIPVGEI